MEHDERLGTVVLLFVELDLVVFSQCDQFLHYVICHVEVLLVLGELRIFLVQFGTMTVQIIHGDAVHQAGSHDAAVIIRVARGVDRDKDIRHDTAAAINDAFRLQRIVLHRIGEMDAIRAHQFAPVVAVDQVMVVLLLVAVDIRFLDRTACRRIIAGNRQADH